MFKKISNLYKAFRDHIIDMNNHRTISVYCGDKGEEPYGRYNIKIRVVSRRFPRRTNVSCKKLNCPDTNSWCGYFDGTTLTAKLERDQIDYLAKEERSGSFIDPETRPYYIEKL